MLIFYFHPTPNPMKVALLLAESGLKYQLVAVDTLKGEQHSPAFKAINPNGKLPAINDDGTIVFDSNAILLYLAEKTNTFLGKPEDKGQLLSWLMFIASGLGPYSGQAVHFQKAAPEEIPYAINRYRHEAERHYQVLDKQLENSEFIVGDSYTIVDIAAWGWIDKYVPVLSDSALEKYPNLNRWYHEINKRPAVAQARAINKDIAFKSEMDEVALKALYPQNYHA
jgi:GST-like protein